MEYCNNFFVSTCESGSFEIVSDGIQGTFEEAYIVGQYISLDNTFLNDGVYMITAVSDTKLTLDATLSTESSSDYYYIFGLKIPTTFLSLVTDIATYDSNTVYGIKSESQGNRSVTYGNGESNGNTWQSAYMSALAPYKQMYSDKSKLMRQYSINSKGWC